MKIFGLIISIHEMNDIFYIFEQRKFKEKLIFIKTVSGAIYLIEICIFLLLLLFKHINEIITTNPIL